MGSGAREQFDNPVIEWIDSRMPIFTMLNKEYGVFPTPRNFNYFWNFGAIAMFMLMTMIVTGIILAMHYTANTHLAFDSVERIMRDVNGGWLLRYIHMNGASFFFIAVYIHIFRGMYYGSYKKPRELLWILGVVIFLLMMATAFIGYVLPWGQMSLWGATVITNLFSAIPFVGDKIVTLMWGGFAVDNPTLTRFFALHYLLPFVIFAVVFLHVWALHVTGSNNPLGIDTKGPQDTIPFNPYYTMKDFFGLIVFIMIYSLFIFYMPDALGHPDNYIPANPLVTPAHIVPEWYFLPFYAILRAITFNMNVYMLAGLAMLAAVMVEFAWRRKPKYLNGVLGAALFLLGGGLAVFGFVADANQDWGVPLSAAEVAPVPAKLGGVLAMFGAIVMLFILPWLDTHPIRSARFRPLFRAVFLLLFVLFAGLGYIGSQPADASVFGLPLSVFGLAFTGYYFGFFLVILPLLSRFEKGRALPPSIHEAVLAKSRRTAHLAIVAILLGMGMLPVSPALASGGEETPLVRQSWSFGGPFGTYDKAALQRGLKIYREVCASCHSLNRVYFRNLEALGYDEDQIKTIAAEYSVTDGPDDTGEMFERAALPSDHFVPPFANDQAAKAANGGALPPDLSLIAKARHGGPDYLFSLLTGFEATPPHGEVVIPGQHWNKYFPGHKISMAPPLMSGQVSYADDGSPEVLEQYAKDISTFLMWAADPYMEDRKRTGLKVLLFLLVFAGVMYSVKRKVWADLH